MSPQHSKNPLNLPKSNLYYQHARDEIIKILTDLKISAAAAVELGCSSGNTGAKCKKTLGIKHYTGIELDPAAAKLAADRLDRVCVADLQQVTPADLQITGGVDLLLALDVLEHLINPWDVLARWAEVMPAGAHAALSIPNVQNISILSGLVQGEWEYASEGLLDATHLRFFTLRGIQDLLLGAGLEGIVYGTAFHPHFDPNQIKPQGNEIHLPNLHLTDLTRDQVVGLHTYQYLVIGRKTG
jgi:hypothetical protein